MNFYQLWLEISKKQLESIPLDRELHFNSLFGNKLRILIPLEGNQELHKLLKTLEFFGYETDINDAISKKIVYKKIKNQQQQEKLRPEKIGGVLQNLIKNYDKLKSSFSNFYLVPPKYEITELLDWWQKNSADLKSAKTGSSIIISRSPIDLVRMSDHDGISSCHSPDGSFFKCAIQEAKTGGAVAYVVKNSDLRNVNLQDQEIFEDTERGVNGIVPLERLRLRRLISGNTDLLLPELRTYGIKNIGFLNAVKDWAKKSQEEVLKSIDPNKDYWKFNLKGGSYQDTGADRVWSDFFGTNVTGMKSSEDEDEENEQDEDAIIERAERQLNDHSRSWRNVMVTVDYYDNTLSYSGYAGFAIPKKLFIVPLIGENHRKAKRIAEDAIDIAGIENLEIEESKDYYNFSFFIYNIDSYYDQLTNFEYFLDYMDTVDDNFDEYINKVYKELIENGYLKDPTEKIEFKNFEVELDDAFNLHQKEPEKIGYLKDYQISKNNFNHYSDNKIKIRDWDKQFVSYINQYKLLPVKLDVGNFSLFLLPNQTQGVYKNNDSVYNTDSNDPNNIHKITGWVYFDLDLELNLNSYKNSEVIKRIKNLDNNWDFYIKKLAKVFEMFLKNKQINAPLIPAPLKPKELNQLSQKPTFKKSKQKTFAFESFNNWIKRKII